MRKNLLIASITVLILLIITNPSLSDFKDNIGYTGWKDPEHPKYIDHHYVPVRANNFFLFSNYYYGGINYLGIAGNFVRTTKGKVEHITVANEKGEIIEDEVRITNNK